MICENALIGGFAAERRPVGRDLIVEVCCDLDFPEANGRPPNPNGRTRPGAGAASERALTDDEIAPVLASKASQDEPGLFRSFVRRRGFSFF